jgi:hypothetical protein
VKAVADDRIVNTAGQMMKNTIRIRLLAPLGVYPRTGFTTNGACLELGDDLAFTAVEIASPGSHGLTCEHYSELEFLSPEETRFFGAAALSLHPDHGVFMFYPLPFHTDLSSRLPKRGNLHALAHGLLESIDPESFEASGATLPPAKNGPSYRRHDRDIDREVFDAIVSGAHLTDYLTIRGLGALVNADTLWSRRESQIAAVMMLHVAMEASFQLTLRQLRERGIANPSALDAGRFIEGVFGNPGLDIRYFADYYEDRIKAAHPMSRFGTFPFPPLAVDDFCDLRSSLVEVFVFLITGRVWPNM